MDRTKKMWNHLKSLRKKTSQIVRHIQSIIFRYRFTNIKKVVSYPRSLFLTKHAFIRDDVAYDSVRTSKERVAQKVYLMQIHFLFLGSDDCLDTRTPASIVTL
jgi:hypothetical protein